MSAIEEAITDVLPSLSVDLVEAVTGQLAEVGVEQVEDLQFVEQEDLAALLIPIQIRKLLHSWAAKSEYILSALDSATAICNMIINLFLKNVKKQGNHNWICFISGPVQHTEVMTIPHPSSQTVHSSQGPSCTTSGGNGPGTPNSTDRLQCTQPQASCATTDHTWPDRFEVPWDDPQIPATLRTAVNRGKRPSACDRKQFVCIMVDCLRKFHPIPLRPKH